MDEDYAEVDMEETCQVCGIPKSECRGDFHETYSICGKCWRLINEKNLEESKANDDGKRGLLTE